MSVNQTAGLNLAAMRADAHELIGDDAELPTWDDLDAMTMRLRGHIQQLIPAIGERMVGLPRDDTLRARVEAGVGEALRRLDETPRTDLIATVGHAQRLARSVNGLANRLDELASPPQPR
jgi:hypothetical protein